VKKGALDLYLASRFLEPGFMAFWLDIADFLIKVIIIVAAIGGLAILIARLARSGEPKDKEIKVKSLNERYDDMRDVMNGALLDRKERKALARIRKREAKTATKARRGQEAGKRIYVLSFKGDLRATAVKRLGSEIDAVLIAARPGTDEAVVRIESPGGTVTGYGLAAAEILRLREHKINVTASVDQVAASGGYMMACAADRIVAAPFAVLGSIGVVAPVPNLHRLLQKNEIDFEEMTSGEFKRTVSVLGEITPEGREHFRGKLEDTHEAFKAHVAQCRPSVDLAKVGNGDHWLAREALPLGLVDEIATGDELLFRARDSARLYEVSTEARKNLLQQLMSGLGAAAQKGMDLMPAGLG
jgi:serine protease SohB